MQNLDSLHLLIIIDDYENNFLIVFLFLWQNLFAQKAEFLQAGINYRQAPIDIENVPRGWIGGKGSFHNISFWRVPSFHFGIGKKIQNDWCLMINTSIRFNHFHYKGGFNSNFTPI